MQQQLFNFAINHWILWILFIIILATLLWLEFRSQVGGVQQIGAQQLLNLVNHKQGVVIDIRDQASFHKGHILGALHIPYDELLEKTKDLKKYQDKPIIITCEMGQRSIKAGMSLRKTDFTAVYSLRGGITAWRTANLPLVKE